MLKLALKPNGNLLNNALFFLFGGVAVVFAASMVFRPTVSDWVGIWRADAAHAFGNLPVTLTIYSNGVADVRLAKSDPFEVNWRREDGTLRLIFPDGTVYLLRASAITGSPRVLIMQNLAGSDIYQRQSDPVRSSSR